MSHNREDFALNYHNPKGGGEYRNLYTYDKFGANRVSLSLLARLANVPTFSHVLGVLLVRLTHSRCHRHLESEIKTIHEKAANIRYVDTVIKIFRKELVNDL